MKKYSKVGWWKSVSHMAEVVLELIRAGLSEKWTFEQRLKFTSHISKNVKLESSTLSLLDQICHIYF